MITLAQNARNIANKLAAASNDPRAMLLPVEYRSVLTDLAMLLIEMGAEIDKLKKGKP